MYFNKGSKNYLNEGSKGKALNKRSKNYLKIRSKKFLIQ